MNFSKWFFLIALMISIGFCKTPQREEERSYSERVLLEYANLSWPKRVEVFELWPQAPRYPSDFQLLRFGLEDEHPAVVISTLRVLLLYPTQEYRKELLLLLNHPDNMVRWHAVLVLEVLPVEEKDLPFLASKFNDSEWLVREAAIRSLRRYEKEKEEKKYFYQILFRLEERNPSLISEVYRSLIWYEDERVYPYLLRRTYVAQSGAELLAMLRELSYTGRPEAINRIRMVARTHNRPDVRFKASELLKKK